MPIIMQLDADTKKATTKIKSASKSAGASVKKLEQESVTAATRMKTAFAGLGKVIGALGFAFVLKGLKSIVTDTIKFRDEIAKFSRATGTSVEFLSSIGFAAQRSGADIDSLGKAFGRLSRNLSDAQRGLAAPREAMASLGVTVTTSTGQLKSLEQIIPELADAFRQMDDDVRKAAVAQELFGRAGIQLIPLLEEGSEGIAKLRKEAEDLGIVFGEKAAIEAEAAADAILDFNTAARAVGQDLAENFLPILTDVALGFVGIAKEVKKQSEQDLPELVKNYGKLGFAINVINVGREEAERIRKEALENELKLLDSVKITMEDIERLRPKDPGVSFVPVEAIEELIPPMDVVIAHALRIQTSFGLVRERSGEIALNQGIVAVNSINAAEAAEDLANSQQLAAAAAGTFSQNLARALVSGQGLEKALLSAAISFGLSFIPGGSLFGGLFAHGGTAPGGFVPSIVGEGGGAPEIIQSASPIRVTPLTTNNDNRQSSTNVFNFPNARGSNPK